MADDAMQKARRAHERLDEHETVHDNFDRRITANENYRLQAIGALKTITLLLGAGGLMFLLDTILNFL